MSVRYSTCLMPGNWLMGCQMPFPGVHGLFPIAACVLDKHLKGAGQIGLALDDGKLLTGDGVHVAPKRIGRGSQPVLTFNTAGICHLLAPSSPVPWFIFTLHSSRLHAIRVRRGLRRLACKIHANFRREAAKSGSTAAVIVSSPKFRNPNEYRSLRVHTGTTDLAIEGARACSPTDRVPLSTDKSPVLLEKAQLLPKPIYAPSAKVGLLHTWHGTCVMTCGA